ncbi:hypothetical protein HDV06_002848 [Boothiomyces sp. JEL0866]|nr:hypothetical protein HDV06_002848 [Boothiomyces sp. JEL0866]
MRFCPRSFLNQLNATDLTEYYIRHAEPKLLAIEPVEQESTVYDFTKLIPRASTRKEYIDSLELVFEISFYTDNDLISKYKFLGTQSVQILLNTLLCIASYTALENQGELSEYIVIENSVYCDQADTVKKIKDWERTQARIGNEVEFEYRPMHTLLLDTEIQFDEHYLFVHQGTCKHSFTIDKVRLVHPVMDPKYIQDYPKAIFQDKLVRPTCGACRYGDPKFCVYGSTECYDGCMWCHQCFNKVFVTDGKVVETIKYIRMNITI